NIFKFFGKTDSLGLLLKYPGKTDGWCSGRQGGRRLKKAVFFVFAVFLFLPSFCSFPPSICLRCRDLSLAECHGLAPWFFTLAANEQARLRSRMQRPCAVVSYVCR